MSFSAQPTALIILDGWGIGAHDANDAVHVAHTPFVDSLFQRVPHARLRTDGEHVGLPSGQMGNSEVGHMNIGAGRIVYQDLLRIDRAVAQGSLALEPALKQAFALAKEGRRLHFMGLVSKGGVHSQQEHLHALCRAAAAEGIQDFIVHAFTDGRDTAPRQAVHYFAELEEVLIETGGRIGTVHGRYFAMDRDQRWERVAKSFDCLVKGTGKQFANAIQGIEAHYAEDITDEFIPPFVVGQADATVKEGDVVICFNFRTDRCREITVALTQKAFPEQGMAPLALHYVTMTNYDDTFENVHVIYDKPNLTSTLGEVISAAGKTQVRIAETEKYPHVTFFFNGGREEAFPGEKRLMAHSPKVATYDLQPEMSAHEIVDTIVPELNSNQPDFVCLNFANPDMVGHTGVFEAVVKAVETTDSCLQSVVETGLAKGYAFVILADHGNADLARNPDGSPHTAHTTNPVPVFILGNHVTGVQDGILADVAPTVLDLMGLAQPSDMSGRSLLTRE